MLYLPIEYDRKIVCEANSIHLNIFKSQNIMIISIILEMLIYYKKTV